MRVAVRGVLPQARPARGFASFLEQQLAESVRDTALRSLQLFKDDTIWVPGVAESSLGGEDNPDIGLTRDEIEMATAALNGEQESQTGRDLTQNQMHAAAPVDPFSLVAADIKHIGASMEQLLDRVDERTQPIRDEDKADDGSGSGHTSMSELKVDGYTSALEHGANTLSHASKHLFAGGAGGKMMRPVMVMLMARCAERSRQAKLAGGVDGACSNSQRGELHPDVDTQANPLQPDAHAAARRLAEITEMIHTASLLHDDVIDLAETRRGVTSVNQEYGNKLAILGGDFVLARASQALARLRNEAVTQVMSSILEHLVKGEVLQMQGPTEVADEQQRLFAHYLRKNHHKTGSLMANSCRSALLLGGHSLADQKLGFRYGQHIGAAFQLVDDVLDFEGTRESLGKPALADLRQGLSTAPVLFAQIESSRLRTLSERKFEQTGDVEEAVELVLQSDGLQATKQLAMSQAALAIATAYRFEESLEREALVQLALKVVVRTK